MGACSSGKKGTPRLERVRRDTDQILSSAASEGFAQPLPEARLPNSFRFSPQKILVPPLSLPESREVDLPKAVSQGDEDEGMLVRRLAGAMHTLGRAYQRESSYLESVKWLKACWELYEYLDLIEEMTVCEGDLALAHLAEGLYHDFKPSVRCIETKNPRLITLATALGTFAKDSTACSKLGTVIKRAKALDRTAVPVSPLLEALIETAHMLRIWLCDYSRALNLYEQALALAPDRLSTYLFLGVTQRALGNAAEGVKCYKRALALDPEYAEAWVNLGNIYFEDEKDLPHAEKCYAQALKSLEKGYQSLVSPGTVYHLLAEVFSKQGFVYNALETCMKGIGVDSMCAENFSAAEEYAEKLGQLQLSAFLREICEVLAGKTALEVTATEEIEGRHKSILLGALGELVQVCHRALSNYHFAPMEADLLRKHFRSVTSDHLRCLQLLYDTIGA